MIVTESRSQAMGQSWEEVFRDLKESFTFGSGLGDYKVGVRKSIPGTNGKAVGPAK